MLFLLDAALGIYDHRVLFIFLLFLTSLIAWLVSKAKKPSFEEPVHMRAAIKAAIIAFCILVIGFGGYGVLFPSSRTATGDFLPHENSINFNQ